MNPDEIIQEIEKKLWTINTKSKLTNFGIVESVTDEIVTVSGLSNVGYYEKVEFDNGSIGFVLDISEDRVLIILLNTIKNINCGTKVFSTGKVLDITISNEIIGRVVDALLQPIDGKPLVHEISSTKHYPIERYAPGITQRGTVNTPLKTGIKAIDILIPIGRGQRELLIGDRGTGKTSIAIDTIINQKKIDMGLKKVICIYCSIGQKKSNLASIVAQLKKFQAMEYTIVVAATASDPVAMQYISPLVACSIGEYFMDKGEDVLIIYDDLIKHAWSYRQISLLIKRPAGREAYPGDIFYLHSRLLERAAKMSDKNGGGSITALPIVETQENDLSAYIPTNIISITDGQIYLEYDLFNLGIRPAINVGLSVSRVGGKAQTKFMKELAGSIRLELSRFRELQSFIQFDNELEKISLQKIERGKRITEILKQSQYDTYSEALELLLVFSITNGLFDNVSIADVIIIEQKLVNFIKTKYPKNLNELLMSNKTNYNTLKSELEKELKDFKATLNTK
ncbi:MAG: F0F1 ATP synthase subunit alpha [Endomicrobium sp.]|jgi:F-type H+-transporting ATPase subunit alpha|nr:F0F1 ATP synthase subunit alpha [Endomicrobium sp.]